MINSLDVFDTALLRNVYLPTDIFKLVEQEVSRHFHDKRIEAEKKAREKDFFYSIYTIYEFLPEFDMNLEIQMELNNCKANPEILDLYNKNPKDYVFISDMYLPSEIIKQMLEKVGYKNPRVFVSWEMKAIKYDGSLFLKVQEKIGQKITKHYGDNYQVDIEGAKKAGISQVQFKPALHNISINLPAVRDVRLKKYLAEVLTNKRSGEDKIAMLTTPLVLGFTKWVLRQRKEGQKIFFLSRDMITPYRLAKELFRAPDVYYLHASRRSLAGAAIQSGDKRLIDKMWLILNEQEFREREKEDTKEVLTYLNKFNIQEGDLIVDIGYSATIQAAIEAILKVKMTGLYMQVFPETLFDVKAIEYFRRRVIQYCLMIEVPLGSDEDCIECYKNGEVIFKHEHAERKALASRMTQVIMDSAKEISPWFFSIFDVEQILIHMQYYPSKELMDVFNKPVYSNRDLGESVINFDKERILHGELKELCQRTYAYKLFKQMLEEDPELKHLSSLV